MHKPVFSIIVPTYQRPQTLEILLESLRSLDFAKEAFEVIVVDDGGTSQLESLRSRAGDLNLRLVTQAHTGPARARNRGAACAVGQYLAFTDDDCLPDRNWLNELLAVLQRFPEHLVGGWILNFAVDNPFSSAAQQISDYMHSYFNASPTRSASFFPSSNIAVSARRFRSVGGFHAGFPMAAGEDREFCHRWLRLGHSMTFAPAAIVYHNHRLTLAGYWRQQFRYGRGARLFRRLVKGSGDPVSFERLSFYAGLLRSRPQEPNKSGHAFLIAISQLAVASGYFWETLSASHSPADPPLRTTVQPSVQQVTEE
jgi:GT2 family glycosyltransferase